MTSHSYEWVVEGDIKACFDEISHPALMDRVRKRVGDKRVLALVKAFLKAGILGEDRVLRETDTGTPQGSILSPLLSNVALSVLDEHIAQAPGGPLPAPTSGPSAVLRVCPTTGWSRYADDWCLAVSGTEPTPKPCGRRSRESCPRWVCACRRRRHLITHIDEGLDFLGWRIQRHRKRGTSRSYVYTYPARKAVKAVTGKVKTLCRQISTNQPLDVLLLRLNPMLRGWCAYFRPGVSSATFAYLSAYTWARVWDWLRRKHRRITVKDLRRRYCGGGWWPATTERALFNPAKVRTTRYRYRGAAIPTPWPVTG